MKKFKNVMIVLSLAFLFGVLPLSVKADVNIEQLKTFLNSNTINSEFKSKLLESPEYQDILKKYKYVITIYISANNSFDVWYSNEQIFTEILDNSPYFMTGGSIKTPRNWFTFENGKYVQKSVNSPTEPYFVLCQLVDGVIQKYQFDVEITKGVFSLSYNGNSFDSELDGGVVERPTEKPVEGEYVWINSPKENTKLSGYVGQNNIGNYKIFDIEVYGRYLSKNGLFDTVGGIRTSIINSTKLSYGDEVRPMGEGLGLKTFEWIKEPKNGEYAEYRMVFYAPMLKIGTYDLTVSQTVKSYDGNKNTYTDTIKNIEFLIDNFDDNIDILPPEGGDSGNVGGDINNPFPTDKPNRPDSLNILDWLVYILDTIVYYVNSIVSAISTAISTLVNALMTMTTELMGAVGKFSQIFGMLPEPMPQLITLSATVLCFTTVINLIRR